MDLGALESVMYRVRCMSVCGWRFGEADAAQAGQKERVTTGESEAWSWSFKIFLVTALIPNLHQH